VPTHEHLSGAICSGAAKLVIDKPDQDGGIREKVGE